MRNFCATELEKLENCLSKATRERAFRWQWHKHLGLHALVEDFGIFLEQDGSAMRVYCLRTLILDTEQRNFFRLSNLACSQIRSWNIISQTEDIRLNHSAMSKARVILLRDLDDIFDQPM